MDFFLKTIKLLNYQNKLNSQPGMNFTSINIFIFRLFKLID